MTEFKTIESTTVEWLQPRASERLFELRTDEARVGHLRFRSNLGTLADGRTAQGAWTFKRVGFLNPRITVRVDGSDSDVAVFKPDLWGHGVVTFRDGPMYAWKPGSFWQTRWLFADSAGHEVLEFKQGVEDSKWRDVFKTQATVTIGPPAVRGEELSILLCLGMYLLTAHEDDNAAVLSAAVG
jgi:hypothetical protein